MTECHRTNNKTSETTALLLKPSLSRHFQDKLCLYIGLEGNRPPFCGAVLELFTP